MTQEKEIEIAIEIIENNFELINLPKYAKIVSIFKPQKLVNWLKDYKRLLEEKTGHWRCYQNNKGDWINQCSVCKSDAGVIYEYSYCPNCGARMIESEGVGE